MSIYFPKSESKITKPPFSDSIENVFVAGFGYTSIAGFLITVYTIETSSQHGFPTPEVDNERV